jgi:hypothetical protein
MPQPHDSETEYIDVQPSSLERLELGTFTTEDQIPEYQFECAPDLPDVIEISLTKTETMAGKIMAMYHIQNYSMETVRVFPRRILEED